MRGDSAIANYRNAFLIYNPFAGQLIGRKESVITRTVRILQDRGHAVQVFPTTGPDTAQAIARRCVMSGADLILAAGGDGTINEVVNGLVHSSVPLAILPGGTANVLAMEMGLGSKMEAAARLVTACVPERVSLGLIRNSIGSDPRHFLLMAGVGLDAHIVYHINPSAKAMLGKLSYWLHGFAQLGRRLPEFDVVANGRSFRCSFALASRVRNYGGDLEIAQDVSLLHDHFELVLFAGRNTFTYLKYMFGILTRTLHRTRGATILRTREVAFHSPEDERIYIQVDGEFAGWLPSSVEIVPDALTLLTPPGFRARVSRVAKDQAWTTSPTP
jgi:YegS/Rv2252/BmrU family lipid kinase